MRKFKIKIKTSAGVQHLDGIFPSGNAAWAAAFDAAGTVDAAISIRVLP
jgi:hypothetical protein